VGERMTRSKISAALVLAANGVTRSKVKLTH
jgi:hypothetical protein